jgi:SWI/SNF-related matrix-associated actin-dependent regulator 1 of chromatin subfamily A
MYNRMYLKIEDDFVIAKYNFSEKYNKVIKKIKGSRFDGVQKVWKFPKIHLRDLCRDMRVNKYYLSLSDEIQKMFNVNKEGFSQSEIEKKERWRLGHSSNAVDCLDFDESALEMPHPLLNYQRGGIDYAVKKGGRILLADDMGLGKTIQGIGIMKIYKSDWPVVIIAPASLLLNWRKEVLKWLPKDLEEKDVHVMKNGKSVPRGKVIICSYHYAFKKVAELSSFLGVKGILFVDEAHNIKNRESKRTQGVIELSHLVKRVVLMTGTPILNRVEELYTLLNAINPMEWNDYYEFVFRYCDAQKTKFGLYVGGISNDEELFYKLREGLMCRRLKTDVLKQLPDKRRVTLTLDVDPQAAKATREILQDQIEKIIYHIVETDENLQKTKSLILSEKSVQIGETLFEAYRLTGVSKTESLCNWVEEKIKSGLNKLIIFGHHKDFLNAVQNKIISINEKTEKSNKLKKVDSDKDKILGYMRIDGSTPKEKRFEYQEKFQNDEDCNIALLSINAANSGLTLTSSSVVIMGELPWTPGVSRQAEDRVHRIGQKNNVDIYYTIADETFDGALWNMLRNKSEIASRVLDYGHGDEMDEEINIGSGDLLSALIADTYMKIKSNHYDKDKIHKKVKKQIEKESTELI